MNPCRRDCHAPDTTELAGVGDRALERGRDDRSMRQFACGRSETLTDVRGISCSR